MRTLHRTYYAATLLSIVLFFDTARAQAPEPGMGPVAAQEKALWDILKNARFDAAPALLAPDFIYAGPEGLSGKTESVAGMKVCKTNSYTLGQAQTRAIGKDAVLISYVVTINRDCGPAGNATHVTEDRNCTSTWVKRDGKWLSLAHTEAIASKMAAPAPPPTPAAQ